MRKGYHIIYGAVIHSKEDHIKLLLTASMVNRFASTVKENQSRLTHNRLTFFERPAACASICSLLTIWT